MLQRARTGFTGANAHRLAQLRNEDLAVANLTRARRLNDGFYHSIDLLVVHRQFKFHFWQEVDHVFRSSIKLSVAFLPPKAFDLCHGNALYPHIGQGGADIVKLKWFDDGDDHFHAGTLLIIENPQFSSRNQGKLLRRSMEYWDFLLYNPQSILRRAREYKKRHRPF